MYSMNEFERIVNNLKPNEYSDAKDFYSNYFRPQKSIKTLNIFKQIMNFK